MDSEGLIGKGIRDMPFATILAGALTTPFPFDEGGVFNFTFLHAKNEVGEYDKEKKDIEHDEHIGDYILRADKKWVHLNGE